GFHFHLRKGKFLQTHFVQQSIDQFRRLFVLADIITRKRFVDDIDQMLGDILRVRLKVQENPLVFRIQFLFRTQAQVALQLGDQELCRERIVGIIHQQVSSRVIHLLVELFSLTVYLIVIIIFELEEFKYQVEMIIQRVEVVRIKDLLDVVKNILD